MSLPARPIAVVTGASAGIGRATVRGLARRGARLGLVARGVEGLQAAAEEIEALGGRALVLPCDVADAGAVEDAAARTESAFGPLDAWVNNAMLSVFSPIMDTPPEEFRRVTEVTYLGVVHGTLAALRRMRRRDRGVDVYVGAPTLEMLYAQRLVPGLADGYLARHAWEGQLDDESDDPARAHNLWQPVPGDRGAHGRFDERALSRSAQVWGATHRSALLVAGAGLAALGGLLVAQRG